MEKYGKLFSATLIALYGVSCFSAFWLNDALRGVYGFALVSLIALPILLFPALGRILVGAVIGGIFAGLQIAFAGSIVLAPLALVGGVIVLILIFYKIGQLLISLPFALNCLVALLYVRHVPSAVRNMSFIGENPSTVSLYLWGAGVAVLGVALMLLGIWIGVRVVVRYFDPDIAPTFSRATILSVGWGWWFVLFILTLFAPHGGGGAHH